MRFEIFTILSNVFILGLVSNTIRNTICTKKKGISEALVGYSSHDNNKDKISALLLSVQSTNRDPKSP